MNRFQKSLILKDLKKKMVLIAGPRQAGKTHLAMEIAKEYKHSVYLNYDSLDHRAVILNQSWLEKTDLIILDELHKMPMWKDYLKGLYDTKPAHLHILVTGSARLEIYYQVGDSLAGRYYLHHLMPFSPAEVCKLGENISLDQFIERSGFPEPLFLDSEIEAKRWRQQYIGALIREDVLDFDNIGNLRNFQLVFDSLKRKVSSPISYKSIAEDVAISPNTVKKYIQILEALYVIFIVRPYSKNIARSILKEPKIYFFDTGLVEGVDGIKFENFFATCLLKHVYAKNDYEAEKYSLQYIRTKENKEVDFALVNNNQIELLIEAKTSKKEIDKNLYYFHEKYNLPAVQVVKELKIERVNNKIKVLKAEDFLKDLYL